MKRKNLKVQLMLDSGAFSAWNQQQTINLDDYIAYLKRNHKWLYSYVTLDVLPFGPERHRSADMVETCAKLSYKNHQTIKEHGLTPIPVFHQGESWRWLDRMLKDGERYIGLSTRKDLWGHQQCDWLDQCFSILCDQKGRPLVFTHGFGVTNPSLIFRYPWHTVDSTTWSLAPGYGQIIIPPRNKDGEFEWLKRPVRVAVTGIMQQSKKNQELQFENMPPLLQDIVYDFVTRVVGITMQEVRYSSSKRRRTALMYFLHLQKHMQSVRFSHHRKVERLAILDKLKVVEPDFQIMYATSLLKDFGETMNDVGANTRLLSYWEMRKKPDEVLHEFVEKGVVGNNPKRIPKPNYDHEVYRNFRRLALHDRAKGYKDADRAHEAT